jgi:hypothetical protein
MKIRYIAGILHQMSFLGSYFDSRDLVQFVLTPHWPLFTIPVTSTFLDTWYTRSILAFLEDVFVFFSHLES